MAPGRPGGTQGAPKRHPGGPRRHPGGPRRHPGGTQVPWRHPRGTLWRSLDVSGDPWDHLGHLGASSSKTCIFHVAFSAEIKKATVLHERERRDMHQEL